MTNAQILQLLGGQQTVRDYLRGVEEGSEADRDAQRAMLAAIARVRAGGVADSMAQEQPELYADACLKLCAASADTDAASASALERQAQGIILLLRTDTKNDE